jgi:YD repeat-containing protein
MRPKLESAPGSEGVTSLMYDGWERVSEVTLHLTRQQ